MHCALSKACKAWCVDARLRVSRGLAERKMAPFWCFLHPKPHMSNQHDFEEISAPKDSNLSHEVLRTGCIWKIWAVNLNSCICGIVISHLDIKAGDIVMKCRVPGCKTVWVSKSSHYWNFTTHIYQFHHNCMNAKPSSKTWSCPVCISAKWGQWAWSYV